MEKRNLKEKEIMEKLILQACQLHGEATDTAYDAKIIHNKIDNLKIKAKEYYRKGFYCFTH